MNQGDQFICSVVIPTKNGGQIFEQVLQAMQMQTCWAHTQLIVVDSGSTDGTPELARRFGALVREIPSAQFNHGATRDLGISLAVSDNIILLVQDAIPSDRNMLTNLVAALKDPDVAGVYARQIPHANADILTKRNLNGWLTGRLTREVRSLGSSVDYMNMRPADKYFFCNFDNVCSAVKKTVWEKIKFGTIDFGEDIDWAERILKAGYIIVYEPQAAVIHSHARPLSYEYKRTYLCHGKLFLQFGLQTVPSLTQAFSVWTRASVMDILYVARNERNAMSKLKMILKAPVLNFLSVLAQYRAVKDAQAGMVKEFNGV